MKLAVVCLAALLAWSGLSFAEDRKSSLSATLRLHDAAGRAIESAESGVPFRASIEIADAITGAVPRNLRPAAWIRSVEDGNASCEDTARAFRVTSGIPQGATDLNGELLAVLNDDGSFGAIDPKLNLKSSNMIAAHSFANRPDDMTLDRTGLRALFLFREEGRIDAVSLLTGSAVTLLESLKIRSNIVTTARGELWVVSGGITLLRLASDNTSEDPIQLPSAAFPLPMNDTTNVTLTGTGDDSLVGVFSRAGGMALLRVRDGGVLQSLKGPEIIDAVFHRGEFVLTLSAQKTHVELRYVDDIAHAIDIPIGIAAERIMIAPDGLTAVAYATGKAYFAVIDLATARVVQAGGLENGATISMATFSDSALYLLSEDGGYVALFDRVSLGREAGKKPRQVPLAVRDRPPVDGQRRQPERLILLGNGTMLAVDRAGSTAFKLHDAMALGNVPPMDAVPLRGGVPAIVEVVDRSLVEVAPGRFEATVRLDGGGPYEIVLTIGIGGLTTCLRFDVKGREKVRPRIYTLSATATAGRLTSGREQDIEFAFFDNRGVEIPVERATFIVASLQSFWPAQIVAERSPGGKLIGRVKFPHAGSFSINPIGIPSTWSLRQAPMLEVEQ